MEDQKGVGGILGLFVSATYTLRNTQIQLLCFTYMPSCFLSSPHTETSLEVSKVSEPFITYSKDNIKNNSDATTFFFFFQEIEQANILLLWGLTIISITASRCFCNFISKPEKSYQLTFTKPEVPSLSPLG